MASIIKTAEPYLPAGTLAPKAPDDWLKWEQVEQPVPNEDEKTQELAGLIKKIVDLNANQHDKGYRATHVKTQGIVKGKLTVLAELAPHLQHGIFKTPGKTYDVAARFANEPSHLQPDTTPGPRGLGLKVYGVTGEFLPGSEGSTQDLHFNNAEPLELRNLETALEIFHLRIKYWDNPDGLVAELKKRPDSSLQLAPSKLPNLPILAQPMFTQSAFRFGPYVAHLSLSPEHTKLADAVPVLPGSDPAVLRQQISDFFSKHDATYTVRAQFASSDVHSVEDVGSAWPVSSAPFFDLATIKFPSQDSFSDARVKYWEDKLALSPWNGLIEHQPLGSINRLRKNIYGASRKERASVNNDEEAAFSSSIPN